MLLLLDACRRCDGRLVGSEVQELSLQRGESGLFGPSLTFRLLFGKLHLSSILVCFLLFSELLPQEWLPQVAFLSGVGRTDYPAHPPCHIQAYLLLLAFMTATAAHLEKDPVASEYAERALGTLIELGQVIFHQTPARCLVHSNNRAVLQGVYLELKPRLVFLLAAISV